MAATRRFCGKIGAGEKAAPCGRKCRRQKSLKVNIPARESAGPFHLLIDIEPVSATGSSEPARGTKVEGEGAWNARKHGGTKRRVWRKPPFITKRERK